MGANNLGALASFRAIADAVRRVPERLGQRTTNVTLRVRVYSGPVGANGTTLVSTTDTVIDPRPKVREVTDGQRSYFGGGTLAASDGTALAGVYEIGPITQTFPGGGYTQGAVVVAGAVTQRFTVLLEGDEFTSGGEEFAVTASDFTHPQRGMLQVTRTRQGA
jgi:hypothetical protein